MVQDEDGEHILSSRDLCTIERLAELLPHLDGIKIEGRSKSEFYVSAIVKAYKHVRDAIINGTEIDEKIKNLVYMVPHRKYRDGFLFHPLKEFPDGEDEIGSADRTADKGVGLRQRWRDWMKRSGRKSLQTTGTTAGPLFNRNYFGTFSPEYISVAGNTYHAIEPKEEIRRGMKLNYLAPDSLGTLEIIDIVNEHGKPLEKADCNTKNIYLQTSLELKGWESLYVEPEVV